MWSAVVINGGARIGRREHFRLIEFACPRAIAHPFGECGRSLKRVLSFSCEKITETEFERIVVVHRLMQRSVGNPLSGRPGSSHIGAANLASLRKATRFK